MHTLEPETTATIAGGSLDDAVASEPMPFPPVAKPFHRPLGEP